MRKIERELRGRNSDLVCENIGLRQRIDALQRDNRVLVTTNQEMNQFLVIRQKQALDACAIEGRLGNRIEFLLADLKACREQLDAQSTIRRLLRRLPVQQAKRSKRRR